LVAILIGMALVYRFFPKRAEENALREAYDAADIQEARPQPPPTTQPAPAPP
jgi:hypothetical protein